MKKVYPASGRPLLLLLRGDRKPGERETGGTLDENYFRVETVVETKKEERNSGEKARGTHSAAWIEIEREAGQLIKRKRSD